MNKLSDQRVAQGLLPFDNAALDPVIYRMARTQPYYDRNRAHICSFFVKGSCNRGLSCPFRHETPPDEKSELAQQNIKDRYYGVNDPVAKKLLGRAGASPVAPPDDISITTLYIGNVDHRISETDLRDHFYYFGEIASISLHPNQHCAFVEFTTREAAETAIGKLHSSLIVNRVLLRPTWAKPSQGGGGSAEAYSGSKPYPSMDPERLGTKPDLPAATPGQVPKPNWEVHPRPTEDSEEQTTKKQKT